MAIAVWRKLDLARQRFGERNLGKADGCTMLIAVRRMQDPVEATLAVPCVPAASRLAIACAAHCGWPRRLAAADAARLLVLCVATELLNHSSPCKGAPL